jgi:hypothetical protein
MVKALGNNIQLTHIIGPKTGHAYHPEAKKEINRRIDSIAARGRDPVPAEINFTTWTLRYNQCFWVTVDALQEHWQPAMVSAKLSATGNIDLSAHNISALTVSIPAGYYAQTAEKAKLGISGEFFDLPRTSDRSLTVHLREVEGKWKVLPTADDGTLQKRHGLQGPIDDAFMDTFLMVRPTGKPLNEKVVTWVTAEMGHAIDHWRRQFRGEAPVRTDDTVSDADIASSNLILWGDPSSNKVLARIADKLPIRWDGDGVHVGNHTYSGDHHVPVLIYPNPLNPHRYVVLNSGFTFREYDYLNNARQVPKLPDYAVIDVNVPVSSRGPGGVVAADFFGEQWELKGR